jgi:hypothetical protein
MTLSSDHKTNPLAYFDNFVMSACSGYGIYQGNSELSPDEIKGSCVIVLMNLFYNFRINFMQVLSVNKNVKARSQISHSKYHISFCITKN